MTSTASLVQMGYHQGTLVTPDVSLGVPVKRPWLRFKINDMRATGNNKTNPTPEGKEWGRRNVTEVGPHVDTVRGCGFAATHNGRGCYGNCYMTENKPRYHIKYWIPVSMRLSEKVLGLDLERLRAERKRLGYDHLRNGVDGDPSENWELTTLTSEFAIEYGFPTVVLTRFWKRPSDLILERLADVESIIHGSVSALDPERHRERILSNLERYEEIGGRSVRRVITAAFKPELEELWDIQNDLMSQRFVLQQPLRIQGTNPYIDLFDLSQYHGVPSHTSGKVTNRWKSAGDAGYGSRGCYGSHCYECWNQCMSNPTIWEGCQ